MAAPKKLLSKLMAFDRAEGLTRPGDRILIAVSGGPDSVCLAHHLSRLARRKRFRLTLIHMNHGLRGREADLDEAFAGRLARKLGFPLIVERLDVQSLAKRDKRSLEDAGRILRYRTLTAAARRLRMNKAAAGHQLDDQAETLLLHLLRGTKAKGLAGMPPKRRLAERMELIRPLLCLSRAEVLAYLKAYGLSYRTDRTNRSERFTRNWIRRKVVPLLARKNPSIRKNLNSLATDVRLLLRT